MPSSEGGLSPVIASNPIFYFLSPCSFFPSPLWGEDEGEGDYPLFASRKPQAQRISATTPPTQESPTGTDNVPICTGNRSAIRIRCIIATTPKTQLET